MIKIFADNRESRSTVFKALDRLGADLNICELDVGDFILSERVGVERKTAEDALSSFIGEESGKIFRQCRDLALAYSRPILMLECDLPELFSRNINQGSIWGMLRSILWNGCAIEFTHTSEGTARRLFELADQEQNGKDSNFQPHGKRSHLSKNDQLIYTLSSLTNCNIGTDTARILLERFGSIEKVATSGIGELDDVPGIGKPTAEKIREFMTRQYNGEK